MDYYKYLKYKNKYFKLNKSSQVGGAKFIHNRLTKSGETAKTALRVNPDSTSEDFIVKNGRHVELEENEEVKVINLPFITDAMGQTFAQVQKNDVNGWVNLKYLHRLPPPLSGSISSSVSQDIRIFKDGMWQKAKQYHVLAFNEFLKDQSQPFRYDNQNYADHVVFTVRRNWPYGGIVRVDEEGNTSPLADFNDVKVLLNGSWHNARPYQRWAYFHYIYSNHDQPIRYYNWLGRRNPPNTIFIPDEELVDVDNFDSAVDFTISRHQSGTVYIQNEKGEILDISDDDTYRKGKVSILHQSALDLWSGQAGPAVPAPIVHAEPPLACQLVPPNQQVWFDKVFGFHEMCADRTHSTVRSNLGLTQRNERKILIDRQGKEYDTGVPVMISTGDLCEKIEKRTTSHSLGHLTYKEISGDIKLFHLNPRLANSLFQVASQFNALEMSHPTYTPEMGITIYKDDRTQGPACAMACPYGTLYRNYFSMPGGKPQTIHSQINTLDILTARLGLEGLLTFENGYVFPKSVAAATEIEKRISQSGTFREDVLRLVKYFIQYDTPVVDDNGIEKHKVSQIYCSALPVAYSDGKLSNTICPNFIRMILHAVYQATFACAVDLALKRNERVKVFLTRVGGGVFGNDVGFIEEAIDIARRKFMQYPIDVYMVNFQLNKNFVETDMGPSPGGIAMPMDYREPRPSPGGIAMPIGGIIQSYWQYESDDGLEFKNYDQHLSKFLDLAYRKDPNDTNVEVNTIINGKPVSWIFNFVNMTQTNINTGSRRRIFRRSHQSYI